MNALHIWTVYDHPRDFPAKFVARKHLANATGSEPTHEHFEADDLEEIRQRLAGWGLTCIPRSPQDDPVIVESWL